MHTRTAPQRVLFFSNGKFSIRIMRMKHFVFFLVALCSLLAASCSFGVQGDIATQDKVVAPSAVPSIMPPKEMPGDPVTDSEAVIISSVKAVSNDTLNGVMEILITGFFPDGCTTLSEVKQSRDASTFTIRLLTTRPEDALCTMALVPFSVTVPLDLEGLADGEICEVIVYEQVLEFVVGQTIEPEERGG
jgi:hypothetical protein